MTKEERRELVYNKYHCGGGFISQEECYRILNEKRVINPRREYSHYNHYYKIRW